jgi:hypothetical protein
MGRDDVKVRAVGIDDGDLPAVGICEEELASVRGSLRPGL